MPRVSSAAEGARMKFRKLLGALGLLVLLPTRARAQDIKPMEDHPEAHYFDFWEGTWNQIIDGKVDATRTMFRVRRSVHPAAFEEEWRQVIDPKTTLRAAAIRAWDKTAQRWMYVWVSENGLFQVWEGRKFGKDWYIVRPFDISGDKYLSRQAWIPNGPDRLIRVSERSNDEGRTWLLRFREEYQRASP
jgi:hypothetical protein